MSEDRVIGPSGDRVNSKYEYAPPGMKQIGPGLFVTADGKEMHFFPVNFCIDIGIPVTEENLRIAQSGANDAFSNMFPKATMIDLNKTGHA